MNILNGVKSLFQKISPASNLKPNSEEAVVDKVLKNDNPAFMVELSNVEEDQKAP